jgi:hypothetical protein
MRIIRADVMKEPRGASVGGSLGAAGIGGATETRAAAVGVVGVSGPHLWRMRNRIGKYKEWGVVV